MLLSAKMYILADKFIAPGLQSLALARYIGAISKATIERNWNYADFPDVVKEVYGHAPESVKASLEPSLLQLIMAKIAVDRFWEGCMMGEGEGEGELHKYPELAIKVSNQLRNNSVLNQRERERSSKGN